MRQVYNPERTFRDVIDDPHEFYGCDITVGAPVSRIHEPGVPTLADAESDDRAVEDEERIPDDSALVVVPEDEGQESSGTASVEVSDTVHRFDAAELKLDLGIELKTP